MPTAGPPPESRIETGWPRAALGLARAVVAGVSVAAVALSVAYPFAAHQARPVEFWWIELLRYLPYPAYLVPALLACGASLLLGRAWRAAAAVSLLLVVTLIMGLVTGPLPGGGDTGQGHVRLMTYNIKAYLADSHPGGFPALTWEIALHDPDVLVMQDAGQLSEEREAAPDTASALFAGRQVYAYGQYIVASRFPLRDCRPGDISYRGKSHTYVRCTLTAHGVDVDLVTAHFLSPRDGLNATRHERIEGIDDWRRNFDDRLLQAGKLAADLSQRQRPLIVAGDLNAPEGSPVVRVLLERGLRDAFSSAGRGYGYTHGHSLRLHISFLRIDHVLVSDEIGVTDSFAGGKEASEHRPVIADLLLHREPR